MRFGFANQGALGTDYTTFTIVTMIIALTAGAVLVMWLGERITESGIGNGISIILLRKHCIRNLREILLLFIISL